MVIRESPVASDTCEIPPQPMARASVAAQRRRARSSSTGSRLVYFVLMDWTVAIRIQTMLPVEGGNWIGYSGETPKAKEQWDTPKLVYFGRVPASHWKPCFSRPNSDHL